MPTPESIFRQLNERLDLPARRRVLLLRELRADFEDLVTTLVAEGLAREAALRKAVQLLAPTSDAVGALSGLYRTRYARLVGGYRAGRVRVVERMGIGVMAGLAVTAPLLALAETSRLSPATLVALGMGAALLLTNLCWQAFRIVVRRDAAAADLLRAGLIQAILVGLTMAVGALLVVIQAYGITGAWEGQAGMGAVAVARAATACGATAALALGITIFGVFGALAVLQWHMSARSVERELHALLGPVFPLDPE